ncbi:MAG: hydrogenase 4 subunit F, partial [Gammaproteobacteria bacterium]
MASFLYLFLPIAGAPLLALLPQLRAAGWLNLLLSILTFALAVVMAFHVTEQGTILASGLRVDAFNVYLIVLTAFVGVTTSIFSRPYMQYVCQEDRISTRGMRLYHSMFQTFMFTMLLALSTDNLGVLWVSVEGATLATVLLVSLYRT